MKLVAILTMMIIYFEASVPTLTASFLGLPTLQVLIAFSMQSFILAQTLFYKRLGTIALIPTIATPIICL